MENMKKWSFLRPGVRYRTIAFRTLASIRLPVHQIVRPTGHLNDHLQSKLTTPVRAQIPKSRRAGCRGKDRKGRTESAFSLDEPFTTAPNFSQAAARQNTANQRSRIADQQGTKVAAELETVRAAFRTYRTGHGRSAVFGYLSEVFALVLTWEGEGRVHECLHHALDKMPKPVQLRFCEAFAIVIYCTVDLQQVDAKTRSKWARVLRSAAEHEVDARGLLSFIRKRGGLNECARRYVQEGVESEAE